MKITFHASDRKPQTDVLVFYYWQNQKPEDHGWWKSLNAADKKYLKNFWANDFNGEYQQTLKLTSVVNRQKKILLIGLGQLKDWQLRRWQLIVRQTIKNSQAAPAASVAASLMPLTKVNPPVDLLIQSFAENAVMAGYAYNDFKARPKKGWPMVKAVEIYAPADWAKIGANAVRVGKIIGEEVNACRQLANTPGGDMTPEVLARAAEAVGKRVGFKVKVLSKQAIAKEGMGGVL